MAEFTLKVGDRLPILEAQLFQPDGVTAQDLSSSTGVQLRYRHVTSGAVVLVTAVVTDAVTGKVKYEWPAGSTVTAGRYAFEWIVTFTGGKLQTFPADGHDYFKIGANLA